MYNVSYAILKNLFRTKIKLQLFQTVWRHFLSFLSFDSDEERRFMYKIDQGHLTIFCIVYVWMGGSILIIAQVQWFVHQNRLEPSDGIYHLYKRNRLLRLCRETELSCNLSPGLSKLFTRIMKQKWPNFFKTRQNVFLIMLLGQILGRKPVPSQFKFL